ncbi:MAG: hypothetical protein OXE47_09285, partial [Gammaproteobacteria bacterium]|nr:hypothetical protein [Gammaproteobacteria bacterium]
FTVQVLGSPTVSLSANGMFDEGTVANGVLTLAAISATPSIARGAFDTDSALTWTWRQVAGMAEDAAEVADTAANYLNAGGAAAGALAQGRSDLALPALTFSAPDVAEPTTYYFRFSGAATSSSWDAELRPSIARAETWNRLPYSQTVAVVVNDVEPPVITVPQGLRTETSGTTVRIAATAQDSDQTFPDAGEFVWTQVTPVSSDIPDLIALAGATARKSQMVFTAPAVPGAGATTMQIVLRATVTDRQGLTDSGDVTLQIRDRTAPTAHAGADQVVSPAGSVTLDGSASADAAPADGSDDLTYQWTQVDADTANANPVTVNPVTLTGATTAAPTFTAPATTGTLYFRLTVTDGNYQTSHADRVAVRVANRVLSVAVTALPPTPSAGCVYTTELARDEGCITQFTVSISDGVADHSMPITFNYRPQSSAATGDVDADHPGDFLITDRISGNQVDFLTATIPVGASSVSFTIPTRDGAHSSPDNQVGDEMTEPQEFWDLELFTLNDPDGYSEFEGGAATLRLTGLSILPSDGFFFSLRPINYFVTEGDTVNIPLGLGTSTLARQDLPAASNAVRITYTLTPVTGGHAAANDVVAAQPLSLLITDANRDDLVIPVVTVDDSTPEREGKIAPPDGADYYETFILSITRVEHDDGLFGITGQDNFNRARIIIRDNDPVYFSVTAMDAEISESATGPGGNTASFVFSFSGDAEAAAPARYTFTAGTAVQGVDFTAPDTTDPIQAPIIGSTKISTPQVFTAIADSMHDPGETIVITITDIPRLGAFLVAPHPDNGVATVTIVDQNAPAATVAWDNLNADGVLVLEDNASRTISATVTIPANTVSAALGSCNFRQTADDDGTGAVTGDAQLTANLAAAAGVAATATGTAPNHACAVTFTAPNLTAAHNTGTHLRARVTTTATGLADTVVEAVVPVELRDGGLPIASAGADVMLDEGTNFSLSGTVGDAAEDTGTTVTPLWSPGAVTDSPLRPTGGDLALIDWSAATVNTTSLNGTATSGITTGGAVQFEVLLTATDPPGNTAQDSAIVTVVDPAAPDAVIRLSGSPHPANEAMVGSTVTLTAAYSTNAAGLTGMLDYAWEQVADDAGAALAQNAPSRVTLSAPTAAVTTFTAPDAAATLHFRLTVTDQVNRKTDSAIAAANIVTTQATPAPTLAINAQYAGGVGGANIDLPANRRVNEGIAVTLSVVATADNDSLDTLSYSWAQYDGAGATASILASAEPLAVTYTNAGGNASATATFNAPAVVGLGEMFFRVRVTARRNAFLPSITTSDVLRVVSRDTLVPTVDAPPELRVLERATGTTFTVTLAGATPLGLATVTDDGDADFTCIWAWDPLPGRGADARFVISDATSCAPVIGSSPTADVPVVDREAFQRLILTVTDSADNTGSDSLAVYIHDTDAPAPTANASYSPIPAIAFGTVTLTAAGSEDGYGSLLAERLSYAWTQVADATGAALAADADSRVALSDAAVRAPTFTAPAEPVDLFFSLQVTDLHTTKVSEAYVLLVPITGRGFPGFTVSAGADRNANEGAVVATVPPGLSRATITLAGSATIDPPNDDATITVQWTQVASAAADAAPVTGASAIALSNAAANTATFTAPDVAENTPLHFRFAATGNKAGFSNTVISDTVTVTIVDVEPPTAAAGADLVLVEGAAGTLAGGGADNDEASADLTYGWVQCVLESQVVDGCARDTLTAAPDLLAAVTAGPEGAAAAAPTFTAPDAPAGAAPLVEMLLTVTDAGGLIATDTVTVRIRDTAAPTASAGQNQSVDINTAVTLDGSGSVDADGAGADNLAYQWTQVDSALDSAAPVAPNSPARQTLTDADEATATFTAPAAPTALFFRLTVTDANTLMTASAIVTVTVQLPQLPVPVVGPLSNVALDEGAFDANGVFSLGSHTFTATVTATAGALGSGGGATLTYQWRQVNAADVNAAIISAVSNGYLSNSGADTTGLTISLASVTETTNYYYRFRVTASRSGYRDSQANRVVTLTVRDIQGPTASAGPDQSGPAGGSLTLAGRASDPENDAALRAVWTQSPATPSLQFTHDDSNADGSTLAQVLASQITLPAVTASARTAVYTVTLTVTDSQGLADTDTVRITAFNNDAPTAHIATPTNTYTSYTVTLDGSGSRNAGGTTADLAYQWLEVDRADSLGVAKATDALVVGVLDQSMFSVTTTAATTEVYFRLTVTDTLNGRSNVAYLTFTPSDPPNPDTPTPTAVAGAPASVDQGATINLSGAGSGLASGDTTSTITYRWQQVAGTAADAALIATTADNYLAITGADNLNATVTAPDVASPVVFTFRLTATASRSGARDGVAVATAQVTVNDTEPPADVLIALDSSREYESSTVSLSATGGADPDTGEAGVLGETGVDIAWSQTSADGVMVSFNPAGGTLTTAITFPAIAAADRTGDVTVTVTVTDKQGLSKSDSIIYTVRDTGMPLISLSYRTAFVRENVLDFATIDAAATRNAAGGTDDLSFAWERTTGSLSFSPVAPNDPVLDGVCAALAAQMTAQNARPVPAGCSDSPDAVYITGVPTAPGNLFFRLTVTDTLLGTSNRQMVTVRVTRPANPPAPTVSLGADLSAREGTAVTLGAAATTTITRGAGDLTSSLSYQWQQLDGEGSSAGVLTNADSDFLILTTNAATATATIAIAATADTVSRTTKEFFFRLTATATPPTGGRFGGSASGSDIVKLTLRDADAPTVAITAGPAAGSTVSEGATLTFTAAGRDPEAPAAPDPDDGIASYRWTQITPSGAGALQLVFAAPTSASTTVTVPQLPTAGQSQIFTVQVVAIDQADNESPPALRTFTAVDQSPPTVVLNALTTYRTSQPVAMDSLGTARADGGFTGLSYQWDAFSNAACTATTGYRAMVTTFPTGAGATGTSIGFTAPATPGTLYIRLTVTDTGNSLSANICQAITISDRPTEDPPSINQPPATLTVNENTSVTLSGEAVFAMGQDSTNHSMVLNWTQVTAASPTAAQISDPSDPRRITTLAQSTQDTVDRSGVTNNRRTLTFTSPDTIQPTAYWFVLTATTTATPARATHDAGVTRRLVTVTVNDTEAPDVFFPARLPDVASVQGGRAGTFTQVAEGTHADTDPGASFLWTSNSDEGKTLTWTEDRGAFEPAGMVGRFNAPAIAATDPWPTLTVTITVTDSQGLTDSDSFDMVLFTPTPAQSTARISVPAALPAGTAITLDGSGSTNAYGNAEFLRYTWTQVTDAAGGTVLNAGQAGYLQRGAADADMFTFTAANAPGTSYWRLSVGMVPPGGFNVLASSSHATVATVTTRPRNARAAALTVTDNVAEGGAVTVTVTLNEMQAAGVMDHAQPIGVAYAVSTDSAAATADADAGDFDTDRDGTANTATDGLPSGSGSIAVGENSVSLTFDIFDDSTAEAAETYIVTVTITDPDPDGTLISGSATAAVTRVIPQNDATTVGFDDHATVLSVEEGESVDLPLTFSGSLVESTADVEVTLTVTATTGLETAEYSVNTPQTFTVTDAARTHNFRITSAEDTVSEPSRVGAETLTITIDSLSVTGGGGLFSIAADANARAVRITDDDYLEVAISSPTPATVAEGAAAAITFSLAVTGPAGGPSLNSQSAMNVQYTLGGSATRGSDYTRSGVLASHAANTVYSVPIAVGQRDGSLSFSLTDDDFHEPTAETMVVTITGVANDTGFPSRALAGSNAATVTINDNDLPETRRPVFANTFTRTLAVDERTAFDLSAAGVSLPSGDAGTLTLLWEHVASAADSAAVLMPGDPGYLAITNPATATATVTSPATVTTTQIFFRLTATNTDGGARQRSRGYVTVTVTDTEVPTANAGPDLGVVVESSTSALSGTAGTDPEGDTVTFAWTQTAPDPAATPTPPLASFEMDDAANPGSTIDTSTRLTPSITWPDIPAGQRVNFTMQLAVTDSVNNRAVDTFTAMVRDDGTPTATAADVRAVTGSTVTISALASTDAAGNSGATANLEYDWVQTTTATGDTVATGDAAVTLIDPDATDGIDAANYAAPTFAAPQAAATFYFRVTVTDTMTTREDSTRMTVTISRLPLLPTPAITFPGVAIEVDERATGSLSASAAITDDAMTADVDESTAAIVYSWTQTTDASGGTVVNNPIALTAGTGSARTFTAPDVVVDTDYFFRVTATADLAGYRTTIANATFTVTVRDIDPPTVDITASPSAALETTTTDTATATATDAGDPVTYAWVQTAPDPTATGAPLLTFSGEDTLSLGITYPDIPVRTTQPFTVQFTATDTGGNQASDQFTVTVRDSTAPTAAAADVTTPVSTATTLSAADSRRAGFNPGTPDAPGDTPDDSSGLNFAWIQTADATSNTALGSGDAGYVALSGADSVSPTFTAPAGAATLHFRVTVTDTVTLVTATARAEVTVSLLPLLPAPTVTVTDFAVTDGAVGMLTGSAARGSGDTDSVITYAWVQVIGRAAVSREVRPDPQNPTPFIPAITHADTSSADASFTSPNVQNPSSLYFRLTATVSKPATHLPNSARATLQVTVNDDDPPTVTINTAAQSVSESSTLQLASTAADHPMDGQRVSYLWTHQPPTPALSFATPPGVTAVSPETLSNPVVTWPALTPTERAIAYTLTLTVQDSQPNDASDTVVITVLDRDGAPTANAGADASHATNSAVSLNGAASTNGGGVADTDLTYAWIQTASAADADTTALVSGDPGYVALTAADTASPGFTAPAAAATLHFHLTVMDTQTSNSATDRVTISILPPLPAPTVTVTDISPNEGSLHTSGTPPTTTLTLATINLTGSASVAGHADATLAYAWAQVESAADGAAEVTGGPTVTHADTAAAAASFESPDVYQPTALYFRLTVSATKTNFLASSAASVLTVTIADVERPTATISTADATVDDSTPTTPSTTTLTADGADADQEAAPGAPALTYAWSYTAPTATPPHPAPVFADAAAESTTVTWPQLTPAQRRVEYTLQFLTTDAQGLTGTATAAFTVRDMDGVPTATVTGPTMAVQGESVTLSGATSANGGGVADTDLTYAWIQTADATGNTALVSGDPNYVALGGASSNSLTFTAPAAALPTLHFHLTVTDTQTNRSATARAQVEVVRSRMAAVTGGAATVAEGATLPAFTLTLSDGVDRTGSDIVTLTYTVAITAAADDTDAAPADFCDGNPLVAQTSFPTNDIELAVGTNTMDFTLPAICDDDLLEPDERFTLSFRLRGGGLNSATIPAQTITITDADDDATVSIARDVDPDHPTSPVTLTTPILENSGLATFTVTVSKMPTADLTVDFTVAGTGITANDHAISVDGTALAANATGGSVTISAGETTARIEITASQDDLLEADEAFSVTISNPQGGGGSAPGVAASPANAASVTITDDDTATVSIARDTDATAMPPVTATSPIAESGGSAEFTVSVSKTPTAALTVTFAVSTTSAGASDYAVTTPASGSTVTIAANQTTAAIVVAAAADELLEGTETFTISISNPQGGGGAAVTVDAAGDDATVSITDDETATIAIARDTDSDGFTE